MAKIHKLPTGNTDQAPEAVAGNVRTHIDPATGMTKTDVFTGDKWVRVESDPLFDAFCIGWLMCMRNLPEVVSMANEYAKADEPIYQRQTANLLQKHFHQGAPHLNDLISSAPDRMRRNMETLKPIFEKIQADEQAEKDQYEES